jgi:hypothetical protein
VRAAEYSLAQSLQLQKGKRRVANDYAAVEGLDRWYFGDAISMK